MTTPSFNCTRCGACCRTVGLIPNFPTKPKPGSNECEHLTKDNLCAIYETRPTICRVDVMRPSHITLENWRTMNEAACKMLQGYEREQAK